MARSGDDMRWIAVWVVALGWAGCLGGDPGTDTGTSGGPPTEDDVNAAIEAANYCTDPEDCTNVGSVCPFGCWILVNDAEAAAIEALIDAYVAGGGSTCTYSCEGMGPIECRGGRCEADPVN